MTKYRMEYETYFSFNLQFVNFYRLEIKSIVCIKRDDRPS